MTHDWGGTNDVVRVFEKSRLLGRRRLHKKNTAYTRPVWVSTCLHVEHRRPKAGDAPHEGLLKVERREVQVFGV